MAEQTDAFQGELRQKFSSWDAAIAADRAKEAEYSNPLDITVRILVWGPGAQNEKGFSKRRQIAIHLSAINSKNEAEFSEDLFVYDTVARKEIVKEEIRQARVAHLVIVLEMAPVYRALGAYSEKVIGATHPKIAGKMLALIPNKYREDQGLPKIITESIPEQNIMYYSPLQFRQCHEIRAFCERKAQEVRLLLQKQYYDDGH